MSQLTISQYEPLLKEDLRCWKCQSIQKNIPTLKAHLQEEWDKEKRKATAQKKRKREQETAVGSSGEVNAEEGPQTKRLETLETASGSK